MLKLSLKQGQYVNIGDNIRVVYVGGSGNHARLLIDAPRELNIARSTTEENPARKRETYYAEPGISREAQQEIKRILWNERMKAAYVFSSGNPFPKVFLLRHFTVTRHKHL